MTVNGQQKETEKISSYLVKNLNVENKMNQNARRNEEYAGHTGEEMFRLLAYEHTFHLFTEVGRGHINQMFKNLIY